MICRTASFPFALIRPLLFASLSLVLAGHLPATAEAAAVAPKAAAKKAIDDDKNGYTVTQGIAPLRDKILADLSHCSARLPG